MKMVTLTRDLRPWRQGDRVPVPDDLAATLVEGGDATDPQEWGAPATAPSPVIAIERPAAVRPPAASGFATRRKGG